MLNVDSAGALFFRRTNRPQKGSIGFCALPVNTTPFIYVKRRLIQEISHAALLLRQR